MVLQIENAESLSFHDCNVFGFSWDHNQWTFSLDIDYIHSWLPPQHEGMNYSFLVAPATLTFKNVSEIAIDLDWERNGPLATLIEIEKHDGRDTPSGMKEWFWYLDFFVPAGKITLWATDISLFLRSDPVETDRQSLRQ